MALLLTTSMATQQGDVALQVLPGLDVSFPTALLGAVPCVQCQTHQQLPHAGGCWLLCCHEMLWEAGNLAALVLFLTPKKSSASEPGWVQVA